MMPVYGLLPKQLVNSGQLNANLDQIAKSDDERYGMKMPFTGWQNKGVAKLPLCFLIYMGPQSI